MRSRRIRSLVASLLTLVGPVAHAQLRSLETRDLRLVYLDSESYLAPHAARSFENSLAFDKKLFGYRPSERVTVLLDDFTDFGNAAATAVPRNFIKLDIAPLSFAFETVVANERMSWLTNHELVHVVAADQAAGSERFFRGLFRSKIAPTPEQPESILYFYLTSPRDAAPQWYHEGLAVFVETWMAGGRGRAQGAYDEMVFRSMARDGSRFYDPLGLVSEGTKTDFQLEVNSYLYGTRFMSYLAEYYSPESIIRWATRAKGTKAYYASQFQEVYGLSLASAWQHWIDWEHVFQEANLKSIREHPVTPYVDLSSQALGSVSRAYFDAERKVLYAGLNYPGTVSHLAAISTETGAVTKILDIKGPRIYTVTSLAYDDDDEKLYYTTDNSSYRDLRVVDATTRKSRTLIRDARVGDLAFDRDDRSLWGIRHFNGIATLVRIPRPYGEWKQVFSWPYGEVPYDIDVSPDGRLLSASVGEIDGRQSLRVMNVESLLKGDATPVATFDFGSAIPSNFVFAPDGRHLYGSSYYTGVSNIFRYDLETGALDAVSNTETGFFRPIPSDGDSLIVFRYTGEGFVPATIEAKPLQDVSAITFLGQQIAEKHPVVKEWMAGSPADIPLASMTTRSGRYDSFKQIRLESILPVVQGYKDSAAYGVRIDLSDPVSLNRASLTASYSPDPALAESERYHLQGEYRRYDWRLGFQVNGADFYDLFGPTKTSLKGYAGRLGYRRTLVYDEPRRMDLNVDLTYYGGLERVPDYQGVPTDFDSDLAARARLGYSDLRHSLGHVDEEKGRSWDVVFAGDRVKGKSFPKVYSDLDLGFALPLRHSSVWLRSSAGYGWGDRSEPFANFFFGGFRNNWVDHLEEKRYREQRSFPGIEINGLGGRNYVKSMIEWNLPPVRFRRAGTPGLYLTWARPALFASGIVTNMDAPSVRRTVSDVGAQLDFRLTALARLDMTLSVGYALAFEDGVRRRDEFMASLRVLK
jgi:hypothetical protein